MAFELAFVDSIASSPTTRLDVNDGTTWVTLLEGTSFGMPPLRRAVAGTLLADGEIIPASAYGNKTLNLRFDVTHLSADNAATQVQLLERELNRPNNIVRFKGDTTNPVFLRTFRSPATQVVWDQVLKRVTAQVLAEPFALGLLESVGALALSSNPATGIYIDVNSVKGDVETPLLLSTHAEFSGVAARQAVFGVRRDSSAITATCYIQAESLTLGTDATTQTVAGYSGGSPNCVRVSFATPANAVRLSGTVTNLGSLAEPRGRYRVYARVKKSVAGDTVTMQLGWGDSAPSRVLNDTVTLPASNSSVVIVDLGDMSVPFGPDPVLAGYSNVELTVGGAFIELYAARSSGSGNVEIDHLAFIPADDQLSLVSYPAYGGGSGPVLMWDGPQETVCLSNSGYTSVSSVQAIPIEGPAALMVSPGGYNRIFGLYDVTPGAATTLTSETYTVSYYPRYLSVARPVST